MKYGYTRELNLSFEEALDELTFCLAEQGFGVMTKIDVQKAMQKKLGKDIKKYMILGACNPHLAFESLEQDYEIALLMPCNVIVYEKEEKVFASVILPTVAIGFVENENIRKIAKVAEEKLRRAIDNML